MPHLLGNGEENAFHDKTLSEVMISCQLIFQLLHFLLNSSCLSSLDAR